MIKLRLGEGETVLDNPGVASTPSPVSFTEDLTHTQRKVHVKTEAGAVGFLQQSPVPSHKPHPRSLPTPCHGEPPAPQPISQRGEGSLSAASGAPVGLWLMALAAPLGCHLQEEWRLGQQQLVWGRVDFEAVRLYLGLPLHSDLQASSPGRLDCGHGKVG